MHFHRTIQSLVITLICASISTAADDAKTLSIIDESGATHSVAPEGIAKLPHHKFNAKDHDRESEFEGVLLVDLLKSVGVEFGDQLKGKRASNVIVLEATDGYRASLALAEIDPDTSDKVVLLADRRDGQPLGEKESPYRLVIPSEKRPLRWIRMIRTIRVVNVNDLLPRPSH
jgi:hypothetical protein